MSSRVRYPLKSHSPTVRLPLTPSLGAARRQTNVSHVPPLAKLVVSLSMVTHEPQFGDHKQDINLSVMGNVLGRLHTIVSKIGVSRRSLLSFLHHNVSRNVVIQQSIITYWYHGGSAPRTPSLFSFIIAIRHVSYLPLFVGLIRPCNYIEFGNTRLVELLQISEYMRCSNWAG
jgi:hypothetical protein